MALTGSSSRSTFIPDSGSARWLVSRVGDYVALTKPRIVELLLITTLPAMLLARRGVPSGWLVLSTLVGGALAAGGANAANMFVDRDIDKLMERTRQRPLAAGTVTPGAAVVLAVLLEVGAVVDLWLTANLLSAGIALAAALFYVFVYTAWLKRSSAQNIVIGGAAGAAPALVGWVAVTGKVAWAPAIMCAIVFMWTPPHFWSLAVRYKDDYRAAGVPMLPAIASLKTTSREMVLYSALTVVTSLALVPVANMGPIYAIAAVLLGGALMACSLNFARTHSTRSAMQLFRWSIIYLTLLFLAIAVDAVVRLR